MAEVGSEPLTLILQKIARNTLPTKPPEVALILLNSTNLTYCCKKLSVAKWLRLLNSDLSSQTALDPTNLNLYLNNINITAVINNKIKISVDRNISIQIGGIQAINFFISRNTLSNYLQLCKSKTAVLG